MLFCFCYSFMNISFSNAVYCDPQGNEYYFESLFLQARNIRYVHIPETVSISLELDIILVYNIIMYINNILGNFLFRRP